MIRFIAASTAPLAICASLLATSALPVLAQSTAQISTPPAPSTSAQPPVLMPPADILAVAKAAFGEACMFDSDDAGTEAGPEQRYAAYELAYKEEGDAPDQAARTATLHEILCMSGAYNMVSVYLITKEYEGTQAVQFAAPAYRVVYENDDSEKGVLRIDMQGFTTLSMMVNPEFDAASGTMTHFSKWRGVGDASSSGKWSFLNGQFVLTHFEVDASYDGEINPIIVYDAAPEAP
jgi:hypothetical protein